MADPLVGVRAAVARFVRSSSSRASSRGGVPPGMMRVTIEDDTPGNRNGLDRLFDALDATLDDMPAIMLSVVPTIRAAHRSVFTSEGSAGRGAWPALAPRTIQERLRLGYGAGPKLRRTGELMDHVLSTPAQITRTAGGVELRIAPAPSVGGVPKYVANALGTSTIPARPMVALGRPAAARVTSEIQRALRARAQAHGLQ